MALRPASEFRAAAVPPSFRSAFILPTSCFPRKHGSKARAALGIAADETVALFVGRLSFHAKAHPHAMYVGLEQGGEGERKQDRALAMRLVRSTEAIEKRFKDGQARLSASVRAIWSEGRDPQARKQAGRRATSSYPFRTASGELRSDADRGHGRGSAMYRQRLGRLQGYGARWHRWVPNCNADAAGRAGRCLRHRIRGRHVGFTTCSVPRPAAASRWISAHSAAVWARSWARPSFAESSANRAGRESARDLRLARDLSALPTALGRPSRSGAQKPGETKP